MDSAGQAPHDRAEASNHDEREREAAQAALRASEARLRLALDVAELGTWTWDLVTGKAVLDERGAAIVGLTPGEPLDASTAQFERIHQDDRDRMQAEIADGIEQGGSFTLDYRTIYVDGSIHHVVSRARVIADGMGRPVQLVGTNRDVTAERRTEAALRASQGLTRDVLDSMSAQIAVLDKSGTITFVNESWRQFAVENGADWTLKGVGVGANYLDVCGGAQGEAAGDAAAIYRGLREILTGASDTFSIEYPCHSPTTLRWFLLTASPLRHGGEGAVVSHQNITERRLAEEALRVSEERFRQVSEFSPQFIWVSGVNGVVEYVNQRWIDYAGLDLAASADPERLSPAIHADERAEMFERWERSVATGEPFEMETRLRRHDGVFRWFLVRTVPLRDAEGRVVKWFGVSTDVHDQRTAEEERELLLQREQAARAEAEAANRAKDQFLSVLSHELRTPLTPIFGFVQMLRRGTPAPERLSLGLEMIERNARIEARIVEDLLDVSRILSGKLLVQSERVDLATIVRSAAEAALPAAESKGVSLTATVEPGDCWVTGDQIRLRQVVDNLLTNAIKFTPAGGAIGVTLAAQGNEASITIFDSGEGIAAHALPRIFDRFHQADSSSTRTQGGLGLGLAIVQHLVERHGGRVHAESAGRGQGATFTVTLPLATRPDDDRAADVAAVSTRGAGRLAGLRILVVDDDEDTRAFLRILLTEEGARVEAAASSAEALATLAGAHFDVLVADVGMPGEDGHTMLARLRSRGDRDGGGTPAIALTAYASAEDRERALAAGFQQHLAKPADLDALVTAILATVDEHSRA